MSSLSGQLASPRHRASPRCGTVQTAGAKRVSVAEGYTRWAATYDRDLNPLLALEEHRLRPMLPCLAGKRVLDLACGTGRWLARLLGEGVAFGAGVDISQAMLAAARDKLGHDDHLVRADCQCIPFPAAAFDLVICSFALGHLPELDGVAREIARVTAPGADIYVSDLHPKAYAKGWRTGFRASRGAVEVMTWPHSFRELRAAWSSPGFERLRFAECHLGEPERTIFARAGKAHLFEDSCRVSAVLIFHFKRSDPAQLIPSRPRR